MPILSKSPLHTYKVHEALNRERRCPWEPGPLSLVNTVKKTTLYTDTLQASLIQTVPHWHSSQVTLDSVKLTIKNNHHTIIFGSVEDKTQGFVLSRQKLNP